MLPLASEPRGSFTVGPRFAARATCARVFVGPCRAYQPATGHEPSIGPRHSGPLPDGVGHRSVRAEPRDSLGTPVVEVEDGAAPHFDRVLGPMLQRSAGEGHRVGTGRDRRRLTQSLRPALAIEKNGAATAVVVIDRQVGLAILARFDATAQRPFFAGPNQQAGQQTDRQTDGL